MTVVSLRATIKFRPLRQAGPLQASRWLAVNYYKTIFRADYAASLRFYDKLYALSQAMQGYPDWWTDRLSVTLQNFDRHCSLHLGHKVYVYAQDTKGKEEDDDARIRNAIGLLSEELEIAEYKRLGFRRIYLQKVAMNFENLVSLFGQKLLAQNEEIATGICPHPDDVAYVVDFSEDTSKIKLRMGPMKKAELEIHLQPDRRNNFPLREQSRSGSDIYSDCPEVALLIDVDYFRESVGPDEVLGFYEDGLAFSERLGRNVVQYLFGLRK